MHQEILGRYLQLLDTLQADVKATTSAVAKEARRDGRARLLMTIPGVGPLTAMVFLAEIGDLNRFPDARCLVSYAGLAPRVRASGGHVHLGRITKQGSPALRWLFTEAAVTGGHQPGRLGNFYRRVQHRHGNQTAAIALARKLLVIAYFVMKRRRPYCADWG